MFNFIALLGWTPGGEEEIFSQEEIIKLFDADRLSKSPAAFDAKKLEWINNHYIKEMDLDTLVRMCLPHLTADGRVEKNLSEEKMAWVKKLVSLYQPQMSYAAQIVDLSDLFFVEHPDLDDACKEVLAGETVMTVLKAFREKLKTLETVDAPTVKKTIKDVQKETGIKGKNLFMPIRVAVSGQMHGPELDQTIELLGKEKSLARLTKIIEEH